MGRLIDVDALKADYGMKDDCADCDKELRGKSIKCEFDRFYSKMDFCGWLDDAPTVDAVPVVRCKDCKFYHRMTAETGICVLACRHLGNDGFCSEGERKDGEQT